MKDEEGENMEIAEKIKKLKKELKELEKKKEAKKRTTKKKFVAKGELIVAEPKYSSFYSLPEEFRKIHISIKYTNEREAGAVGVCLLKGGMIYYYLEGWIVGIGGGTMILDVPHKATEIEWQSIIDGNVPRKFLRNWVKKIVK